MSSDASCVHCGKRIVWQGNTSYPSWVHQPAGAAFMDGQYYSCKLVAAEPVEGAHTTSPADLAAAAPAAGETS